ncbi:MAG: hypothetical protein GY716_19060 [bacterium]|nr:hypothetical protein [bacterium]
MPQRLVLIAICTSCFLASSGFAEDKLVAETYSKESRSLAGDKSQESACKYAIQAATRKAKAHCKEELKGELVPFVAKGTEAPVDIVKQCHSCKQSEHWLEWYCTGKVTMQCSYHADVDSPSLVNQLRGQVQKDAHTPTDNPCVEDTQTEACADYRKQLKKAAVGGSRN